MISEAIKSSINEGIFRKHVWYTFEVTYYEKNAVREGLSDYFKLGGEEYGDYTDVQNENGWFVYRFKDGMTEEPVAEIARANVRNAGAHINSINGLPKKFFRKYEDAVRWCQSKGIKVIDTRDKNGMIRKDEPPRYNTNPSADAGRYSANGGAKGRKLKTCTVTIETVYRFVTRDELLREIKRLLREKCRKMGIVPVRARCIGQRESFV